jgi:KDO2-lipid IV(A) lauroyltransferase
MLGYFTSAASKAIKGFLIQRMMVRFRSRRGMKNISRENSYKKLVKALEAGDCLIVMIDQDTKVKGVFVDFYGKKAYTPMGVSRLALETGAIVVPMAMVRKEDSKYKFIIRPPLETINTGNLEKDLYDNTQQQTLVLEKIIRQYPTQWVWMHRRWKTTPESLAAYLEQRAAEKAKRNKKQNA